jgi:hypothetical protein
MAVRSVPQPVLDEALEVLGELGAWLRLTHACPKCDALQGCSHQAGCPLGRIARLRCVLGSEDPQRREDELVALRRERGERTLEGDPPLPSSLGPAVTQASVPGAPTDRAPSAVPLPRTADDVASQEGSPESRDPFQGEAHDLVPGVLGRVEAEDDERARAFVVETLQLAATRCFAEASAMRIRADRAPAGPIRANAAALCERAGRYAEAATRWLTRNGTQALLGQGALLGAFTRDEDRPSHLRVKRSAA